MKEKKSFKNVIAEMARNELSQDYMSDKLGMSKAAFFNRVHGITPWSYEEAVKLEEILKASKEYLMERGE